MDLSVVITTLAKNG